MDDRDHGQPWLPCLSGSWCGNLRDRWAASVVNAQVRALYYSSSSMGGLVFAPRHIRLLCAYSEDGDSLNPSKVCDTVGGDRPLGSGCIPGCAPRGAQCHELSRLTSCSFPPDRLDAALQGQLRLSRERNGWRNNEVVLDMLDLVPRLPQAIAGFFYMSGSSEHDRQEMRRHHAAFVAKYGFPTQMNPPLMELDLESNTAQPFRLVPMEHQWMPGQG